MTKETESDKQSRDTTVSRVLALSHFCEVSPRMFEALWAQFKTLDAIYAAEPEAFFEIEGIDEEWAENLSRASDRIDAAEVMVQALSERDIGLITRFDDAFGHLLFELNDPPSLLFYRGRMVDPEQKSVAVVGCRVATSEGMELTARLVKELVAQKVQIISSLVGGIDISAHLATKSAGGSSFGVLNCGFDHIDRAEKLPVAIDIVESGGVISEYAPEVEIGEGDDTETNRLIVGMAQAVVVTEAYAGSKRVMDLLQACREVGKMAFFMIDPDQGALADETSMGHAANCGAIPIQGFDHIADIVKSLV
jgi:DNA processing protein